MNLADALELLYEAETVLGHLKLARRGLTGRLAFKFWREIDQAWSAVYFAVRFLEEAAKQDDIPLARSGG